MLGGMLPGRVGRIADPRRGLTCLHCLTQAPAVALAAHVERYTADCLAEQVEQLHLHLPGQLWQLPHHLLQQSHGALCNA